jgi:hypothetical protein
VDRDQGALKSRRWRHGEFDAIAKMPDKSSNPIGVSLVTPVWISTFRLY